MKDKLTPQEIVDRYSETLNKALISSSIETQTEGLSQKEIIQIWLIIDKNYLKSAVKELIDIHYPHLSVVSGCDVGDVVELSYHFYIYYGEFNGEYSVNIKVILPKTDLTVDTITDMIPGALVSEREKQEFLGIKVVGIPDNRRLFLPDNFPEGVFPWRKDETGIKEDMFKKLYDVGKEEGNERRQAQISAG